MSYFIWFFLDTLELIDLRLGISKSKFKIGEPCLLCVILLNFSFSFFYKNDRVLRIADEQKSSKTEWSLIGTMCFKQSENWELDVSIKDRSDLEDFLLYSFFSILRKLFNRLGVKISYNVGPDWRLPKVIVKLRAICWSTKYRAIFCKVRILAR